MKNETIRQFVRRELRAAVTVGVATAIGMGGGLPAARANPVGGAVVSGQGSITNPNSTTTLINQQSNSLILNWSSFNVASNETVQFVQPSSTSVALNNILSQSPSQIFGKIDANGRVVLINPNGILFGRTAQLNVGSLIASSLELKEFDPTTGRLTFQSLSGSPGVIDNEGSITAGPGGSVALLGGTVLNNGLVVADYGTVAMGAGNVATLDFYGGGLLRLQVSGDLKTNSTGAAAAVQNNGQIQANGGQVVLTASATQDVFASAVNNTGVIRANRVENVGGVIELSGPDGVVANSGTLDASGKGAGSTGGTVKVTGNDVGLFGTSTINASGPAGGGTVLVGGGFHGADSSVQDASRTYVDTDATIDADATASGNGGNVAVWSNDGTRYYGNISARGAGQGSGGYVEVSGKAYLDYEGLVDLRAPSGNTGTLLLDPAEITIEDNVTDSHIATTGGSSGNPFTDASPSPGNNPASILSDTTINTQLATASVVVSASGTTADTNNGILISNASGTNVAIAPATANGNTLTLTSATSISWDSSWSYTNNGQLTLSAAGGSVAGSTTGETITIGGTSPVLMQASAGVGTSAAPVLTSGLTSVAADGGTGGVYITNSTSGDVSVDSLTNPVTTNAVNGLNAGTAVSLVNNAGAITLSEPVTGGTGTTTLQAVGVGATLALGTNNVSGTGVTLEGTGVTQSSGSTVDAGAGDILVDGGAAAINMAGALTTTSTSATATTIQDATTIALPSITTGSTGTTTIGSSSAVTQNSSTAISTGTLTGTATGSVTLDKANTIPTLGAFTANGFTLSNDGDPLSISGTVAGGAGGVDLVSSGAISESSGAIHTTGTLTTSSVGGATLGGANVVSKFNATNTTGGNVSLTNGAALTITGISQAGGGTVGVNNAGGTTVTGTVSAGAGDVTLTDTGAISESGSGLIKTTGTLTTSSVGGTTLGGANVVSNVNATNSTSGNVSLANSAALTITGISQAGGGTASVNNAGGTTVTGTVSAGAGDVTLTDTGAISESGSGLVSTTGTLTTSSVGGTTLGGANVVNNFNATNTTNGNISLTNGAALTITGISQAGGGTVGVNNAGGTTVTGTVSAGAGDVTLTDTGAISESGSGLIKTTGTLTTSSVGGTTLGGANVVGNFNATNTTSGNVSLNNGTALTITGISQAGGGTATVSNTGGTTVTGTVGAGAGSVSLTDTGAISESGGHISTTGTLTTHSAGGTTLTGANTVGTFSATNTGLGPVTLVNGAGLTITGLSQTGGGLVSVTNTTPITLSGANSTDGSLSLTSNGGGVTLGSTAGDALAVAGTLSVSADGSIIEQTGSTVTAGATQLTLVSPAGDLILKNAANLGTITLTGTGHDLDLEGTNQTQVTTLLGGSTWTAVTVVDGTAVTLPGFDVLGALAVTAPGITQSGPLVVGTTTTLTSPGNAISLAGGNSFGGEVDFSGSDVTLASTGPLMSAGTASGNLSETAGGTISEGAAGIKLTGTAGANTATFTVTGATHDVDLGSTANNFETDAVTIAAGVAGVVGNVRVADTNPTSLSVILPGTLTSLVLSDPNAPIAIAGGTLTGVGAGTNLAGGTTTLAVTAGGAITQTGGALAVTGTSAFTANGGASDISLINTGNAFNGGVTLTGNNVTVANTLGTTVAGASTAGNLTLDAGGAVAFGATGTDSTTVTNGLIVQGVSGSGAAGGAVSQAGTLSVGTTTSINAGTHDINLANSGNSFTGAVTLTGAAVTLANSRATTLGGANSAGSLTLDAGAGVAFGTVGTDSMTVTNGLIVQGVSGSGATGGAVTQAGTLSVGTTTSIDAGANTITLSNAANTFTGAVTLTGGAVTLANADATTLGGTNSASSLTLDAGAGVAFGTVGTDSTTVTNGLIVQGVSGSGATGGAVSQVGRLGVGGTSNINTGGNAITLGNSANSFGGNVAFTGAAVTLASAGALSSSGTASGNLSETAGGTISEGAAGLQLTGTAGTNTATFTVTGATHDVDLGSTANNFNGEATTLTASGGGAVGNVRVVDTSTTFVPLTLPGTLTSLVLNDSQAAIALPEATLTGVGVGTNLAGGTTTLDVTAGGAITQDGGTSLNVTGGTSFSAAANAITVANAGNIFTGNVAFTGGTVMLASDGALSTSGSAGGDLRETAGGTISEGAAGIQLTGTAGANTAMFTVTGAPDDVDLGSTANNFNADAVTIAASGAGAVGNVRVVDTNPTSLSVILPGTLTSLVLSDAIAPITLAGGTFTGVTGTNLAGGATTLDVTAGGTITQTGALLVTGTSAFSANAGASDINLSNVGNAFNGGVTLTGNNVTVANTLGTTVAGASTAGNLTLDAGGAVAFGATGTDSTTVTGNLVAQGLSGSGATGGAVAQAGTLSVGGTTSIDAGTNAITLSNAANTLAGAVTVTGGAVTLANADATTLGGANSASSLTLDAGAGVAFGTVGTDSTTVTNNLIVQGASGGGAAGGTVTLAETVDVGGTLTVTAPGISQSSGPLIVTGTTTLTANANPISLTDAGNSFGGEVDFMGSAVTLTSSGALTSAGTASGNLAETAGGNISEGAAGITLTGSAGTNTATFTVTGGTHDVDLDPANNFNGEATTITASGGGAVGNVAVEDTNATFVPLTLPATLTSLVLNDPNAPITITGVTLTGVGGGTNLVGGTTTLAVTAGGAITQSGALSVTGTTTLDANGGASDITLSNAANALSGGITLSGKAVTLANTAGTTLAGADTVSSLTLDAGGAVVFGTAGTDSTTVAGNLVVQGVSGSGATGGAVTQVGTLTVGGTTWIDAGTNDITLSNSGDSFTGALTLIGGAVTLANSRATTLVGANSAGSLTLDSGGAVAFGSAGSDSTTVTNGLIVQGLNGAGSAVGGAVTQAGTLNVGTTASINAGANDITLGLANTFGGNVAFGGHNVTLATGTGDLMTSGTASGTLTETSAGSITQGGALSVTGRSTLTANGGAGDITLANAGNAFAGAVTLSGAAVTLANADATTLTGAEKFGSLTLDAGGAVVFGTTSTDTTTVTNGLIVQGVNGSGNAGGSVTQAATLNVGTTTLIQAGTNDINLGLMNTFGGGVTFNGRNVLLNAKGSLTTVSGTASGTLTAIAQGASANLNVGNLSAGGDLLLIAGNSVLGTSAQATVIATDAQVRYGIEDANGQLGSATNPSQQIGFQAAPGAGQVQLTVWLPAPGTQLQGTDLRPTQSDLSITKQAFQGGSLSALYSPNFNLTAAQLGSTVLSSTAAVAGTQTQSAQAQSAATQGSQSVLIIDWGSYNPNVSLFGTLNPAVCLPADQRDDSVSSGGSGCAAASASLLKPPAPIQLAMVPTQEGWKAMPLFNLAR